MTPLPLLLLPGTLCDAALWQGVWPPGAESAGRSGPEVLRGRTLAGAAEHALRGAPARVHLVGFSLGAIVACEVLRRAPKRVARLTLIAANPHAHRPEQLAAWAAQEAQVEAGHFAAVAEAIAPQGPQRQRVLDMAGRVGPGVFAEHLALMRSRPDSRPALTAYAGPLTLLVGADDAVTPPALAEEVRDLRRERGHETRLIVVPGAGHFLPLDAPQAVAAALKTELEAAHA